MNQGVKEFTVAAIFVLANIVVPLTTDELYPFSNPKLFVDAPKVYCNYTIRKEDGTELNPKLFGLEFRYFGLEGYTLQTPGPSPGARRLPTTVVRAGHVASREEVVNIVQKNLKSFPSLDYVDVTQLIVGDYDGNIIGMTGENKWRIHRLPNE